MAYAPALLGAVAGLAVILTVAVGVIFAFRAIPRSPGAPWSLVRMVVGFGAAGVLLAESDALSRNAEFDGRLQLGLLAATAAFAAVALVLDAGRRALAVRMANADVEQRDLIAALPNPVIVTDADGRITTVNRAGTELLGPGVAGARIDALLPFVALPGAPGLVRAWHGRIAKGGRRALDAEVQLSVALRPGGGASAVYVVSDVSELATATRLREELLYSVAHELRQPLTVLDNTLDILSRDYLSLSAHEFEALLASSRRTVHRLRSLMDQLLNAGTIESGRFAPQLRPVSLRALVDDAAEAARPELEAREQRLEIAVAPDIGVMADARYAQQVLANLLENASKYGPRKERVDIRAVRDGRVVRVSVTDHGAGIPPEEHADLFRRFYRASSSGAEPGVGLGLAIAKGIVEAHGGHIGVVSEMGMGTTVWFTLRLAEMPTAVARA